MLFYALSIEGPDLNFVNCVSFRSHLNAYMKKVAMIYKDYEICVFLFLVGSVFCSIGCKELDLVKHIQFF